MNKNQWKLSLKKYWSLYMKKKNNIYQKDVNYILTKKHTIFVWNAGKCWPQNWKWYVGQRDPSTSQQASVSRQRHQSQLFLQRSWSGNSLTPAGGKLAGGVYIPQLRHKHPQDAGSVVTPSRHVRKATPVGLGGQGLGDGGRRLPQRKYTAKHLVC